VAGAQKFLKGALFNPKGGNKRGANKSSGRFPKRGLAEKIDGERPGASKQESSSVEERAGGTFLGKEYFSGEKGQKEELCRYQEG